MSACQFATGPEFSAVSLRSLAGPPVWLMWIKSLAVCPSALANGKEGSLLITRLHLVKLKELRRGWGLGGPKPIALGYDAFTEHSNWVTCGSEDAEIISEINIARRLWTRSRLQGRPGTLQIGFGFDREHLSFYVFRLPILGCCCSCTSPSLSPIFPFHKPLLLQRDCISWEVKTAQLYSTKTGMKKWRGTFLIYERLCLICSDMVTAHCQW